MALPQPGYGIADEANEASLETGRGEEANLLAEGQRLGAVLANGIRGGAVAHIRATSSGVRP
jgi:hypothetical protein